MDFHYFCQLYFYLLSKKNENSFKCSTKYNTVGQMHAQKMYYNNFKNQGQSKQNLIRMFYYVLPNLSDTINDIYFCFLVDSYGYSHFNTNYLVPSQTNVLTPKYTLVLSDQKQNITISPNKQSLISLKTQVSQTIESPTEVSPLQKSSVSSPRTTYKKCKKLGIDEIKLDFRTQWKNQNRNIVPNLINQMMSYILKKNKSSKLINKLFGHYSHAPSWTVNKFYLYMKKIKDSVSHYVNESIIQYFFQIHEPKCEIYQEEEQQFYMKLCRIAILSFLRSDVIIISLTSSRMSEAKRKTHLVARQAILNKFLQLARH